VLFDSAPSFGTRVDGVCVGARGDAQIFSFHATKAFNTMEGGALVSRDPEIIRRARRSATSGRFAVRIATSRHQRKDDGDLCADRNRQLKGFDKVVRHRFGCTEIMRSEIAGFPDFP
jgi:dTDP-4-amino-4,6-dideoxygalactose transaminase